MTLALLCGAVGFLFLVLLFTNTHAVCLTLIGLTVAFPKAGVTIPHFPIPVFLFGLLIAIAGLALLNRQCWHRPPGLTIVAILLGFLIFRCAVIAGVLPTTPVSTPGNLVPFTAWSLVPLALYLMATQMDFLSARRSIQAAKIGYCIAAMYGVYQTVVGAGAALTIPGLTSSFGSTIRNNVITSESGEIYNKIYSTYQSGNEFGVVSGVVLVMTVADLTRGKRDKLTAVTAALGVFSLALSGSRTALVAGVVGLLVLVLSRRAITRLLIIAVCTFGAVELVRWLNPALAQRYDLSGQLAANSSGGVRVTGSENLIHQLNWAEWIVGALRPRSLMLIPDGVVGFVGYVGLIGLLLYIGFAVSVASGRGAQLRAMFTVLGTALLVDSSYGNFPTWFIPAALIGMVVTAANKGTDTDAIPVRSGPLGRVFSTAQ